MCLPIVDGSSLETMLEVPSYHPYANNDNRAFKWVYEALLDDTESVAYQNARLEAEVKDTNKKVCLSRWKRR